MFVRRIAVSMGTMLLVVSPVVKAYGPFDYTNPEHVRDKLPIVEAYHFNADVEFLRKGIGGDIWDDLVYTIERFPNHHRALNSLGKLWLQHLQKGEVPPGRLNRGTPPKYWFERAIKFAPHDGKVRCVYGIYLYNAGKLEDAVERCKEGEKINPESPEIHYNLGLLYFAKKDYHLARLQAKKAYELGYPLPGLRNKLISVGAWKE